jgi:predicted ATPase
MDRHTHTSRQAAAAAMIASNAWADWKRYLAHVVAAVWLCTLGRNGFARGYLARET